MADDTVSVKFTGAVLKNAVKLLKVALLWLRRTRDGRNSILLYALLKFDFIASVFQLKFTAWMLEKLQHKVQEKSIILQCSAFIAILLLLNVLKGSVL